MRTGSTVCRRIKTLCYSTNIFTAMMAAGPGASHQSGWTALVAELINEMSEKDASCRKKGANSF